MLCFTGSNHSKKQQVDKDSVRLKLNDNRIKIRPNAKNGRAFKPNFVGNYKRPNKGIDDIEDRPRLRIRPNEVIKRNKPRMCICNNGRKLQWIIPV